MTLKKERILNLDKYLYLIILIFGTTITGCISIQNNGNNGNDGNDDTSFDIKNIKINNADNDTNRIIYHNLREIDQNATRYISSINIVSEIPCEDEDASGCTIGNFTSDGRLIGSSIYLLSLDAYKDSCNTFEHSLYHELGHTIYFYKYGNHDLKKEDEIYQESLELYAEKYADNRSKIQKEGCDRKITEELRRDFKEKEKMYEYAIKIMSKWDRYSDSIPSGMRDEYEHDYGLYQDIKNQYNSALDKYRKYMVVSNNISK